MQLSVSGRSTAHLAFGYHLRIGPGSLANAQERRRAAGTRLRLQRAAAEGVGHAVHLSQSGCCRRIEVTL